MQIIHYNHNSNLSLLMIWCFFLCKFFDDDPCDDVMCYMDNPPGIWCLAQEHNDNGSWTAPWWLNHRPFSYWHPLKEPGIKYLVTMDSMNPLCREQTINIPDNKQTTTPWINVRLRGSLKGTMVMACGSCLAWHQTSNLLLINLEFNHKPTTLVLCYGSIWPV